MTKDFYSKNEDRLCWFFDDPVEDIHGNPHGGKFAVYRGMRVPSDVARSLTYRGFIGTSAACWVIEGMEAQLLAAAVRPDAPRRELK